MCHIQQLKPPATYCSPSNDFFFVWLFLVAYLSFFLFFFAERVLAFSALLSLSIDLDTACLSKKSPGTSPKVLQCKLLNVHPMLNWQTAKETPVSRVFLPTKFVLGQSFQIRLWSDSFEFWVFVSCTAFQ